MFKTRLLVIALGAAFALPAMAEEVAATNHKDDIHVVPASEHTVTENIGIVTDYIYRGITQTSHKPALQGGVDYGHSSGLYAGVWASNVSWINDSGAIAGSGGTANIELDTYFGIKNTVATDYGYDFGYVRYNYLGNYSPAAGFNNADTAEVYAMASYKWALLKYSYSLLDGFLTVPGTKGTNYLDLSANYPVADSGVTIGLHYGKQTFVGTTKSGGNELSYNDYKLSVSKDFSGYVLALAYINTNVTPAWTYNGEQWGKSTVTLSATRSF